MKYKLLKISFKTLHTLFKATPSFLKKVNAIFLANVWYLFHKNYRDRVFKNLNFIYPDLSYDKKVEIAKGTFLNLVYNLFSFIENYKASKEEILKKVKFKNDKILIDALNQNRPIIFLTAHYSNWEILPLAIAAKYTPLIGVGRPLNQPNLNRILTEAREQFGIKMISKFGATRELLKAMKQKEVVGLLMDQNLGGIEVDFFGKKTIQATTIATLAYKFNAIVLPCFIKRVGFEKYEASFYEPIKVEAKDEKDFIKKHTQKEAKIIENIIKEEPSQWLWIHRRWKETYPEIYR